MRFKVERLTDRWGRVWQVAESDDGVFAYYETADGHLARYWPEGIDEPAFLAKVEGEITADVQDKYDEWLAGQAAEASDVGSLNQSEIDLIQDENVRNQVVALQSQINELFKIAIGGK